MEKKNPCVYNTTTVTQLQLAPKLQHRKGLVGFSLRNWCSLMNVFTCTRKNVISDVDFNANGLA